MILVTGCAGFIGYHVCQHLLNQGKEVIGIDNINDYYDVRLKEARLAQLKPYPSFTFHKANLSNQSAIFELISKYLQIHTIVHLAAQAGIRYSLKNPFAYTDSNVTGHLTILESARLLPTLKHLVYASSSSVYGANDKLPFSVHDPVEQPISLYAATKRSCELMSYTYSHLFALPITGLRFFTVYGPWGRPDMSAFLFTKALFNNEEIAVFNYGDMRRNFTYIEDIVQGVLACMAKPSAVNPNSPAPPHRIYNIGNNRSENLMDFIQVLEKHTGKKAKIRFEPIQPGDVKETIADISDTTQNFGFVPKTNIEEGLKYFVEWYRGFYGV